MAKAMGLIFSLFDVTSAFWHTVVCTMHSSWTYRCPPLCPIHTVKHVDLAVAHEGFPS